MLPCGRFLAPTVSSASRQWDMVLEAALARQAGQHLISSVARAILPHVKRTSPGRRYIKRLHMQ